MSEVTTREASTIDLNAIDALAADAGARAADIEAARSVPDDLVTRLVSAGVYGLCVPRALGGGEVPPAQMVEVLERLAYGDGATGWCAMIGATTGVVAAYLPADVARTIFATGPRPTTAGVFAPLGTATPVASGYRVRGRWPFASGCERAAWLMGGCRIADDPTAPPRMAIVPSDAVTIVDTWKVAGLRGTGSHDIVIDDVDVPADRTVSLVADRPRADGPLYAFPVFGLLALGIAAVALGIARAAIDELCRVAGGKRPSGSRRLLGERPTVQVEVAQAEADRRSARALLDDAVGGAWRVAARGEPLGLRDRALLRLATTHATRAAAHVTTRMYTLGGGSAIYEASPLQRHFRDAHVATQHTMVAEPTLEVIGRVLLGIETDTAML